jgi:multiple sugar transport system ATP-binding protein
VVFGIRPEHTLLADAASGIPLQVAVVEPTGANIQVYADIGGAHLCAIFTDRHEFNPGDTIYLGFPETKIHLFDATSGQRL